MKLVNRPLSIIMFLLSFLIVFAIILQILTWNGEYSLFIIFCSLCGLLFTISLSFDRNSHLHNPLLYIFLTVFVGITVRAYYMVYAPNNDYVNYVFLNNRNIGYFVFPAFLSLCSFLSLFLGYTLTNKPFIFRRLRLFSSHLMWNQKRLRILIGGFSIISILGIYLFINKMGIGSILGDISSKRFLEVDGSEYRSSLGYYRLMARFIEPAFYIFLLNFIVRKKSFWSFQGFILVVLGLFNLFFPIFTSSRTSFMYFIVNILIILSLTKRLSVSLLSTAIVSTALLFTVVTTLRSSSDLKVDDINVIEAVVFNRNLLDISVTANIIHGVPEKMPYQYGASVLALFVAPIPRTAWPEKPSLSMGKDIANKIYGYNKNLDTAIPPKIIGELYVNFGVIGVLLGLFFIGIMLKRIYLYFNLELEFNLNKIILYVGVVMNITVLLFGGSFNQAVLGLLQSYIPIYLGLKYISVKAA